MSENATRKISITLLGKSKTIFDYNSHSKSKQKHLLTNKQTNKILCVDSGLKGTQKIK